MSARACTSYLRRCPSMNNTCTTKWARAMNNGADRQVWPCAHFVCMFRLLLCFPKLPLSLSATSLASDLLAGEAEHSERRLLHDSHQLPFCIWIPTNYIMTALNKQPMVQTYHYIIFFYSCLLFKWRNMAQSPVLWLNKWELSREIHNSQEWALFWVVKYY